MTAQAAGLVTIKELPSFVEQMLPNRRVYEPSPERHSMYQELFEIYLQLSGQLKENFAALAGVTHKFQLG